MKSKKMVLNFLTVKWNGFLTLSLLLFIFGINSVSGQVTRTASVTGNWNATATWGGQSVPTAIDNVIINNGVTVTITDTRTCATLVVNPNSGNNTSATLSFTGTGANLTVTTSINLGAQAGRNGIINMTGGGTLNIQGSIVQTLGSTLTAGTGTVNYTGVNQTVFATPYNNLTFSGSGSKNLTANTTVTNLIVNSGVTLSTGTFTLSSVNTTFNNVGLAAGGIITGTGAITLGGNLNINYSGTGSITSTATISNPLALGANRTFSVADDGTTNSDFTISGLISGVNFGITKTGTGTLTLSEANTYSGGTTLTSGTLNINNASAIGTGALNIQGGTIIDNTTAAAITLSTNNPLNWNGSFTFTGTNSLNFGTGAVAIGADISITSSANIVTFGGAVTGTTRNLTKAGAGTLAFGANAVSLNNLVIDAGTYSASSGNTTLSGNFTNNATFNNNGGTLIFAGALQQTIGGTTASVFNGLTSTNLLGVKALNDMTVNGVLTLASNPDATNGNLDMVIDYQNTGVDYAQGSKANVGTPSNTHLSTSPYNALNSKILTLGSTATFGPTSVGDVTGKIFRAGFINSTSYAFGNKNMTLTFNTNGSGTLPTNITVVATRGSRGLHIDKDGTNDFTTGEELIGGAAVKRLWQILRTGGALPTTFSVNFPYEETELNGNNESELVTWDHHLNDPGYPGLTPHEHGKTSLDLVNNTVGLTNHSITYMADAAVTTRVKYWMLSKQESTINTWLGAFTNTPSWNDQENWTFNTVPDATSNIVIPSDSVSGNSLTLVTASVGSIEIKQGATVNGGSATTLTVSKGPATEGNIAGSWVNNGTFNPSTSTIVFDITAGGTATLAGTTNFNNLTVNAGTTLELQSNSTTNISGTLTNSGAIDATTNANTVVYTGETAQVVANTSAGVPAYNNLTLSGAGAKSFAGNPTISGNFEVSGGTVTVPSIFNFTGSQAQSIVGLGYKNIVFSGAGTKTFTSDTTLAPDSTISFTGTPGVIDFDGPSDTVLFKLQSNSSFTSSIANATGWTLNGNLIAERQIFAKRAWRLMTSPLVGSTNNMVYDNWQNSGPGTGMLLWNPQTLPGSGMVTGTGIANFYRFGSPSAGWNAVSNTITEPLFTATTNNSFLVFSVGPFNTPDVNGSPAATTATPKGKLRTGDIVHSSIPASTSRLLGNPYASSLDIAQLRADNPTFTIWFLDPNIGSFAGFVSYNGSVFAPQTNGLSGPSLHTYSTTNTRIESGQAIFVRSDVGGNFTFKETQKSTQVSYDMSRQSNSTTTESFFTSLRVNLLKSIENQYRLVDGIASVFDSNETSVVNGVDARKLSNSSENIMFRNTNISLSIDMRSLPLLNEELPMRLTNTSANTVYQLELYTEQYQNMSLQPYLLDTQTQQQTPVPMDGSSLIYPFTAMASTSTQPDERFKIVFQNATLSNPVSEQSVMSIYPNPVTDGIVYFTLNDATSKLEVTVTSLSGQTLINQQEAIATEQGQYKLDLSKLESGIYFIQVKDENQRQWTHKLLMP